MVQAVAEAVVALQHVSDPGQAPVRPLGKLFEGQGVTGAFFPGEGGLAVQGTAFGHPHGAGRKRIAVVEMGAEVESGLQGMKQGDDMGRHGGRYGHVGVARPVFGSGHASGQGVDSGRPVGAKAGRLEQPGIFSPQVRGQGNAWGHGSSVGRGVERVGLPRLQESMKRRRRQQRAP